MGRLSNLFLEILGLWVPESVVDQFWVHLVTFVGSVWLHFGSMLGSRGLWGAIWEPLGPQDGPRFKTIEKETW